MTIPTDAIINPRAHAAVARTKGICIRCEKPPVLRTPIEIREYRISALCGPCWDDIFPPDEDDAD